ncbi:hypothetical protein [Reinekea thalattae]|uniref:Uncharacterized protein n=1 Tax=Reinekea thalattae TaxID=2593301 RepID=A0A5C8Z8E6_9GAMM|nr:hypothetical protein [Reinekea thalattae]TXR53431.1 hypothetical protein FME95_02350 [Reinekea thalattae]
MDLLIAICSSLLVIGAFLWLKPSKRDQHLAQLRSSAIAQGFLIGSIKLPDTSEYGRVNQRNSIETLYRLALEVDPQANDSPHDRLAFTILRTSGESGIYLPNGWAWQQRQNVTETHYQRLAQRLAKVPEEVTALVVNDAFVGLVWNENTKEVSLQQLAELLSQLAADCDLVLINPLAATS